MTASKGEIIQLKEGTTPLYVKTHIQAVDELDSTLTDLNSRIDGKQAKFYDTGWIQVALRGGWQGNIKVRQINNFILHSGSFWDNVAGNIGVIMFQYPDVIKFDMNVNKEQQPYLVGWTDVTSNNKNEVSRVYIRPGYRDFYGSYVGRASGNFRVDSIVYPGGAY